MFFLVHCAQSALLHLLDVQFEQVKFVGGKVQPGEPLVKHAVVQASGAAKADTPLGSQEIEDAEGLVVLWPDLGDIEVGLGKPYCCQLLLGWRSGEEGPAYLSQFPRLPSVMAER